MRVLKSEICIYTHYIFGLFAKNIKGISYGETFHVVLNEEKKMFSWAEVTSESSIDGWWRSSWFGTFYANDTGWILHEDLSWIFILAQPNNRGVWLLGWLWTNKSSFGHLFLILPNLGFIFMVQQSLIFFFLTTITGIGLY